MQSINLFINATAKSKNVFLAYLPLHFLFLGYLGELLLENKVDLGSLEIAVQERDYTLSVWREYCYPNIIIGTFTFFVMLAK